MKRQRHVNLLELFTSFVWDHYLWMVMPFVSGGSLEVLLRRGYPKVRTSDASKQLQLQIKYCSPLIW